jgi:hypothetical protein
MLRVIVRLGGVPVWSRLWPRVEAVADRHARRVARQSREELGALRAELRAEIAPLREAVDRLSCLVGQVDQTANEVRRMVPHVAALDQRVAGLERPQVADAADCAEGRALVAEIRSEHARGRARLSAVARYEEPIARLERAPDQG